MNEKWSLDKLYTDFDSQEFINDFEKVDKTTEKIQNFMADLDDTMPEKNLLEAIQLLEERETLFSKIFLYCELRQSVETTNAEATAYSGKLKAKFSKSTKSITELNKYISSIPDLKEIIDSNPYLKEFEYYLLKIQKNDKYALSDDVEDALSKCNISGGSAWSDLQSYLTSTLKVNYDGGITTLPNIRNLAFSADPEIRKAAYDAEIKSYDKIKDSIAFSLNSIKLQVIHECSLRGFKSPLQQTLFNSDMKRETLDALLESMVEYMPKFREYFRTKGKALGHEDGLPWYDMFAPMGSIDKTYTTEDAQKYLVNIFADFSPELSNMVNKAFTDEWIDFFPREGKVGGAFCAGAFSIKESRVLTNFTGNFSDVVTLAHELGHAYHNYNTQSNNVLNTDYSMPVAETASIFNENLVINNAIKNASNDEEKLALVEGQLSDAAQIICDIYSRFLFENSVFENRENGFMFADELSQLMHDAQMQSYGDGLVEDTLNNYMWINKSHYYSSGLSYYNFPYAFGGLFARGLYAKYLEEGEEFLPTYKKFLKATTVMNVEDAGMVANIDLTEKEFWIKGLQSFADEIDVFKELVDKIY